MNDLKTYSNDELFGLINHLDPFKYQDKIKEIETEIIRREQSGAIPEQLVPDVDWSVFRFRKRKN